MLFLTTDTYGVEIDTTFFSDSKMERRSATVVDLVYISTLIKKVTHQIHIPTANRKGQRCTACQGRQSREG
jgi:hypothetical protein